MKTLILTLVLACAAGTAHAQIKCWNDANGKRTCGDAPPPGAKVTTLKTPTAPEPAPPASGKDAKKRGPLTPAEQEQDFRKRQKDAQKAAEKAAQEQKVSGAKRDNCQSARASAEQLQSGGRIARTNAQGERYYLDEDQISTELAKARKIMQEACN